VANPKINLYAMVRIVTMKIYKSVIAISFSLIWLTSCLNSTELNKSAMKENYKVQKTDSEWKQILSPEQYKVLRQKATERPFSGEYNIFSKDGIYYCAACGAPLFKSSDKFTSDCGWPSFTEAIDNKSIITSVDTSFGMVRTEITCAACGGHLGHLFDDGPGPGKKRYCVNSVSLKFKTK